MYKVIGIQETGEEMTMITGRRASCLDWIDSHAHEFPEFRGFYIEQDVNLLQPF